MCSEVPTGVRQCCHSSGALSAEENLTHLPDGTEKIRAGNRDLESSQQKALLTLILSGIFMLQVKKPYSNWFKKNKDFSTQELEVSS